MKDPRIYVIHIRDCLSRIRDYTADGKDSFFSDTKTQDAVIRNLETMADATQNLPEAWKATCPEIDWRSVAGFRNVLAHQYLDINLNLVWNIVENQLPVLSQAIEAIAAEFWNQ
ncbi:HepT-like ribonuclease domain-containing protein [Vacuolonema iberomarrocanum]|uniref:HepT-like ribonuclease domain-containing protein n=1 Tax=Vacuolonema iberomarrocanum TaxID=3454632 RepID=UPI001A0ACEE0|nr:DUF86 domain-containing protein [filamentous cyanobacterium LEGE 07170]